MTNYNNSSDMRPFSDNLVDLHISVVPMNHWVEKLNYASHKIIGDTFSAGFIRVLPDTSVAMLRQEISEQLGSEIFPEDYVFLKHIGRCLALIRQSQEKDLKVKHFLPPHSVMPEIFVLPGQPAMYTYKVLPPIQPRLRDLHISWSNNSGSTTNLKTSDSASRSLHTKSPYKYNDVDRTFRNSSSSPEASNIPLEQPFHPFKPQNHVSEGESKQIRGPNGPPKTRIPSSVQKRELLKRQQRHVSGKSNYDIEVGATASYEQEQYPPHYKNKNGDGENPILQKSGSSHAEETTPSLAKSVLREGPRKRRVRYNMPPQSNASSQDNELPGVVDLSAAHVLSHPDNRRFLNHSSGSESSLHSNLLDERGPDSLSPNNYEMNFNQNGRDRKQFIDTSSHALSNPSNHSLGSNQNHFASNSNPVAPSSPMSGPPPDPQDARFNPDSNVSNGVAYSQTYLFAPENEAPTGEKWEGRDLTKSSSANNDSGYVEHELSESDEYFFKDKSERFSVKKTGQGAELHDGNGHNEANEDEVIRVGLHVSEMHDTKTINSSSVGLENSTESAVYITTTKTSADEPIANHKSSGRADASDQRSVRENESSMNQNPGVNLSQNASGPRADSESEHNRSKSPTRIYSQDSSYQYDFYGRSEPTRLVDPRSPSSDGSRSPHEAEKSSSDAEEGSKLSYRLSKKGYRVKSSRESAKIGLKNSSRQGSAKFLHSVEQIDHQLHNSTQFEYGGNHDEDIESDNDGSQSSFDDFEKEMAKLTEQAANVTQENMLEVAMNQMDLTTKGKIITSTKSDVNDLVSPQKNLENLRTFSPEGEGILKRDSVSGSSVRSPTAVVAPVSQVVHYSATASFETESVEITKFSKTNHQMLLDNELLLESGQSRGAPDGMPTLRKVNTGSSDKANKLLVEAVVPPKDYVVGNVQLDTSLQSSQFVDKRPKRFISSPVEPIQSSINENHDFSVPERRMASPSDQISTAKKSSKTEKNDLIQTTSLVSPSTQAAQSKKSEADKKEISKLDSSPPVPQSNQLASDVPTLSSKPSSPGGVPETQIEKRLESPARAQLWEELQKIRAERRKAEKQRQELVQQAKVINSKMNQKRSSATSKRSQAFDKSNPCRQRAVKIVRRECRFPSCSYKCLTEADSRRHYELVHKGKSHIVRDMWKKKFFEEKKKTLPLEETCRRLQAELESTHRRMVTAMETNKPNRTLKKLPPIHLPPPIVTPSSKTNTKIQATRLQHDMDSLRRQIEDAKIKLTGEIKLRHQAEQDVKTVRQELLSKKIKAHIAYRELSRNRLQFSLKT